MSFALVLFWMSIGCILYSYAGYPIVLMLMSSATQLRSDWRQISGGGSRRVRAGAQPPRVAVLVAAYNEERHIEERVRNLLSQDYPEHLLHVYVGSDGSDDRTAEILRAIDTPRLTFIDFPMRRGKASVLNDLVSAAREEIIVLTDANTSFRSDAVSMLMRHFGPADVGCVCGELRLLPADAIDAGATENQDHIYWRYERMLKFFESRIGALLGANGGVYALKRRLYKPIPANTIVDDFWISMQVVEAGERCVYDPEAIATEAIPERIGDEFRRRVRIGVGNYQALRRFFGMLSPSRGAVAISFFSHKCLRWLVPHFMVIALLTNALLAAHPAFAALLVLQVVFYLAAWIGYRRSITGKAPRPLRLPLFFVSMNLGLLIGFWNFVTTNASGTWTRSAR